MAGGSQGEGVSMLKVFFSKDSEIAKLKALGVVEPVKEPDWAVDQVKNSFPKREYGHQFKTIVRGSKKRT